MNNRDMGHRSVYRLTVMPADAAATVHQLVPGNTYLIGRSAAADIQLNEPSVSRTHARVDLRGSEPEIIDLDSLNGVSINGEQVASSVLADPCWLRLGDLHAHFERLEPGQQGSVTTSASLSHATGMHQQLWLDNDLRLDSVARSILAEVCRMLTPERAYLLSTDPAGSWKVLDALNHLGEPMSRLQFGGSRTALERCIAQKKPVIMHEISPSSWLGHQASVMNAGLHAILAFPMLADSDLLGVIYVDSRRPGASVTDLDLALLKSLAGQAAMPLWLARMNAELQQLQADFHHQSSAVSRADD